MLVDDGFEFGVRASETLVVPAKRALWAAAVHLHQLECVFHRYLVGGKKVFDGSTKVAVRFDLLEFPALGAFDFLVAG